MEQNLSWDQDGLRGELGKNGSKVISSDCAGSFFRSSDLATWDRYHVLTGSTQS